jgi:2-methylcitrate dehydratase
MRPEQALFCLIDSLACGLQALQHPAAVRRIGPVVPGATMAGGARVPGTSYDLDPVQAAFCIGTLIHWLDANDASLVAPWGHPSDNLGGILAIADYLSRLRLVEGGAPLLVGEVLAAVNKAHDIQRVAAVEQDGRPPLPQRTAAVRVATAATVASMLGGTMAQVSAAVSCARLAGATAQVESNGGLLASWALADAGSRGVQLALLATRGGLESAQGTSAADAVIIQRLTLHDDLQGDALPAVEPDGPQARILERFRASVAAHFPPAQASRTVGLFADHTMLVAMPIHELIARLVRN